MTNEWQVGSIARVKRPSHPKAFGKAMIAMMDSSNDAVSILWELASPQPLITTDSSASANRFLVAPRISTKSGQKSSNNDNDDDEDETTVPLNELLPLMKFETSSPETSNDIGVLKEHGDALLRAGDASAAVAYYEAALSRSCQDVMRSPSIGSSIILKTKGGYLKVAEIDCVEKGDTAGSFSLDVAFVESGEEMEVSNSTVVLGILMKDGEARLQERILLNLSRCLHQLADIDEPKHRSAYLKGAILACSLAMVLAEFHGGAEDDNEAIAKSKGTLQSALHLRAKAYILLSKWPHAKQDAKRLIQQGKEQQGTSLLDNIEKRKQVQVKRDKKLAKAVAKLVQNVTADGERASSLDGESRSDGVSAENNKKPPQVEDLQAANENAGDMSASPTKRASSNQHSLTFLLAIAIVGIAVSFLAHKALSG